MCKEVVNVLNFKRNKTRGQAFSNKRRRMYASEASARRNAAEHVRCVRTRQLIKVKTKTLLTSIYLLLSWDLLFYQGKFGHRSPKFGVIFALSHHTLKKLSLVIFLSSPLRVLVNVH